MDIETRKRPLALVLDKDTIHTDRLRLGLDPLGIDVVSGFLEQYAQQAIAADKPDIIFIDPKDLGFGVKRLKEITQTPVVVMSDDHSIQTRLAAYEEGAELYLLKSKRNPPQLDEIISPDTVASHTRAIVRRFKEDRTQTPSVLQYNDLVIDAQTCMVLKAGFPVHIDPIQRELLRILVSNVGIVLSPEELLTKFRGEEYRQELGTFRGNVSRLRSQLGPDRDLIQTVLNRGYLLPLPTETTTFQDEPIFDQNGLVVTKLGRVSLNGQDITLTASERHIMIVLALNSGHTVSYEGLLSLRDGVRLVYKIRIRRMRQKIDDITGEIIQTRGDEGYQLG